jgi:hypothetical protein
VLYELGEVSDSLEYLEDALSLSRKIGERWFSAIALMYMTDVFRLIGDVQQARLKLREGLEIACALQTSSMRAKYLLEAALLWCDQGHVEQSAIWVGLLVQYDNSLNVDQRRRYDQLRGKLEVKLGKEQFIAAIERGKALNLDNVVQGILKELR